MNSSRPYLIRALHEWILDNDMTPYILIDAEYENVMVPVEYISDGKIVLNITPGIVTGLNINNDIIEFDARFSGKHSHVFAPIRSVLAIYAKENGRGMVFPEEDEDDGGNDGSPPAPDSPPPVKGRPHLKVVK